MKCRCGLKTGIITFSVIDFLLGLLAVVIFGFALGSAIGNWDKTSEVLQAQLAQGRNLTDVPDANATDTEGEAGQAPAVSKADFIAASGIYMAFGLLRMILAGYLVFAAKKEKATHCAVWLAVTGFLKLINVGFIVYDYITTDEVSVANLAVGLVGDSFYTLVKVAVVLLFIQKLRKNRTGEKEIHEKM